MLNKKQISELPKGYHLNSDLNVINPKHCAPANSRPIRTIVNVGTIKKPIMVSLILNRKQRRQGV